MNRILHDEDEGPEVVPPAELLRLRSLLMRGPRAITRARHIAAATTEARQRPLVAGAAGRFATWGGRVAVGIVASLAITSGLAGAQLLPQPAQRLLSGVSDRFSPPATAPSTTVADTDPSLAATGGSSSSADRRARSRANGGDGSDAVDAVSTTSPPTTDEPLVVTTIPGPTGPGSPTDPTTDPEEPDLSTTTTTSPSTTTTTIPPSTTTTTTPPSTTTTTSSSR